MLPLVILAACSSGRTGAPRPDTSGERPPRAMAGRERLSREEASAMLGEFYRRHGVDFAGLPERNGIGGMVGQGDIFFEYVPADSALRCDALIYRFHEEPKPGVIEGFMEEAKSTPTGGGIVVYEPENRGLYLARVYGRGVSVEEFADDMNRLLEASQVWGTDVLERVATKVFEGK